MRDLGNEEYEIVSIGPTTSMRMEKFEKEFIEETGVKVIVGKGGMGKNTEEGCRLTKRFMSSFQREMLFMGQRRSKKLKKYIGKTLECLNPFGYVK
ncbi:hypothetical protein NCCP133_39890 [Cytobacillus sp. NCCP-133]|nr:hypothetical protein NCCP133_39890 [Cytobacillus sp. NCCP-133]